MGARELQALLREIKNVRSPVQRMKLMALAWRTVARLTPAERKELGSKLGVRGYERILEKLGPGPQGIAPVEVLQALDGAEDLDSSRLRGLVRGLRDPERRKELLRQGLDFLDRSLAEDEPAEVGVEEAAEERTVIPEPVRQPEPVPVPTPEPEPAAPIEEEEPEPAERVEEVEVPSAEPAPIVTTTTPIPAPRAAPPAAPVPARTRRETLPNLGAAREPAPSLIARFRTLRRALDEDGERNTEEIRGLLSPFPEGWARRRAVMSLLRRGYPATLDDALSLIEGLERPTDRRWACATLIDSRELSDDDARRIVDRFPFPSLARRLRRRSGSAPSGD